MGSARDGSPDPTRASNSACLLQSVRTHVLNQGGRGVWCPVDSLEAPSTSGVLGGNRISPQ
jgi:hypothetical protein